MHFKGIRIKRGNLEPVPRAFLPPGFYLICNTKLGILSFADKTPKLCSLWQTGGKKSCDVAYPGHIYKFVVHVCCQTIINPHPLHTFSAINLSFLKSQVSQVAEQNFECISYMMYGCQENMSCVLHLIHRIGKRLTT